MFHGLFLDCLDSIVLQYVDIVEIKNNDKESSEMCNATFLCLFSYDLIINLSAHCSACTCGLCHSQCIIVLN